MILKPKFKNISVLFGGSIVEKLFGFIRELLIAYLFGATPAYAAYLSLSVFVDAFVIFTGDNALQANIVPRYSVLFKKFPNLSLKKLKIESLKIATVFFLANLFILLTFICFNGTQKNWMLLIIILSITVGIYVFNSIGLMILQAKGEFISYTKGSVLNSSVAAILIYPLSILFGVVGLAVSRLLGIAAIYLFAWKKDKTKLIEIAETKLSIRDFNIKTIIVANFYVLIILFGKLLLSFSNDIRITYFTYATIVFGIIITTLVRSISTVLLHDSSLELNMKKITKSILFVFITSLFFSFFLYFFADSIVSLLYQRGHFSKIDVIYTTEILKVLIIPFILQALSLIMIQPILSEHNLYKIKFIKITSIVSLALYFLFFILIIFFKSNAIFIVFIMSYSVSFVIFILCCITLFKMYKTHVKFQENT